MLATPTWADRSSSRSRQTIATGPADVCTFAVGLARLSLSLRGYMSLAGRDATRNDTMLPDAIDNAGSRDRQDGTVSTLNVWTFDGAEAAENAARHLRRAGALPGPEAAVVIWWPPEQGAPSIAVATEPEGRVAPWWVALFDTVFMEPLRLAAAGEANLGAHAPPGIAPDAVNHLRDDVVPAASALLVLAESDRADRIADALFGIRAFKLSHTEVDNDLGPR